MKSRTMTIALMICLVLVVGTITQDHSNASTNSDNQQSANTLESVNINYHNSSWSNYNFPGDGSASHPYIIEGNLDVGRIVIINTNAYFILRVTTDCNVELDNITHGEINGSNILENIVFIVTSNSVKIENSVFNSSFVILNGTSNSLVEDNTFLRLSLMLIHGANNNTIANNTFKSNSGIYLNQSNNNIIKNNVFNNGSRYDDYSGTNNVFISAPNSKSMPELSFEVFTMTLILGVVFSKKIKDKK